MKTSVFKDLYPQAWKKELDLPNTTILEFNNLPHFKHVMSTLTQKDDNYCGVTYAQALKDLLANVPQLNTASYETTKNLVKNNLVKRGLISENVYENYMYNTDDGIIDPVKIIEQDPACFLAPAKTYKNYFYELYINISYPGRVSDSEVMNSMAKILATVELLEKEHIFIKVTLIDVSKYVTNDGKHLFTVLPLFSHRDPKSVEIMSAVLNDRLLRKFMFALSEHQFGNSLSSSYGKAFRLSNTITPVDVDEVELASSILNRVITEGTR